MVTWTPYLRVSTFIVLLPVNVSPLAGQVIALKSESREMNQYDTLLSAFTSTIPVPSFCLYTDLLIYF